MMPTYKETRLIAYEVEGSNLKGEPLVQTKYDFALIIDAQKNKPAFMVNTGSQVLFPSNDRIMFGCFEAFFFDDKNIVPTVEQLWKLVREAYVTISEELRVKTNLYHISVESPDKKSIMPQLRALVLSGFRLN